MATKGGARKVHAVAFSFNAETGLSGVFAFAKAKSADKAADEAVHLVVRKLQRHGRYDQVEHKTGLTEDDLADWFEKHYEYRDNYLFHNVSSMDLV